MTDAEKLAIARKMIRRLAGKDFYKDLKGVDDPEHPLAARIYRMAQRVYGEIL